MKLDREKLGEALREAREARSLTPRDLEKITGVSFSTIYRAERAHPDIFARAETVCVLGHVLGVDPRDFVEGVSRENTHDTNSGREFA